MIYIMISLIKEKIYLKIIINIVILEIKDYYYIIHIALMEDINVVVIIDGQKHVNKIIVRIWKSILIII